MKKQKRIFILVYLLVSCLTVSSQKNFLFGESQTIHSSILNENRPLFVYAPDNLKQKLPLIIVLDGENLFEPTVAAMRFMNNASEMPQMPPAIVVGIQNTNRDRDMPAPQQFGKKGETNFLSFLSTELLPYLKAKYNLNDHVLTIGHSQGALFASYLLSQSLQFSWVVALDAPMNVDQKTKEVSQKISLLFKDSKNKARYVSVESWYGWENNWETYFGETNNAKKINLTGETHEAMPFKGIYDGLKFLFHDFAPQRKDLFLPDLKLYYKNLSGTYGYEYEVPLRVLLVSARRNIGENRKKEVTALLDYAESKYGTSDATASLRLQAAKITQGPSAEVDYYLTLPKPTAEQVKKYVGRWQGELVVPRGQNMGLFFEILTENGMGKMLFALPWDTTQKIQPEIFGISKEGKLIFGRKNTGRGLVVSTADLNGKGDLIGEERFVGFTIPDDVPADVKEEMKFSLANPNTFTLKRKRQ